MYRMPAGRVSACSTCEKPSVFILPYPVFFHPIAQGVSGDAKFRRGAGLVPVALFQYPGNQIPFSAGKAKTVVWGKTVFPNRFSVFHDFREEISGWSKIRLDRRKA